MPQHIEKKEVAKSFSQAADEYDQYARIQHVLANELLSLCPKLEKNNILDLGCGTGYCLPELQKLYAGADVTGGDLALGMLQHAQNKYPQFNYEISDAENLPFSDGQFDLIFSSLAVQWCDDFSQVLHNAYRCLKPGGHLVLSTLAVGTLNELEQSWLEVDQNQHVNAFSSSESLQSDIEKSDFFILENTQQTRIDYHQSIRGLTDSLKRIGAHNITQGRAKGLTSPAAIKKFKMAMEQHRTEQGLPASYVVFSCLLQKPL